VYMIAAGISQVFHGGIKVLSLGDLGRYLQSVRLSLLATRMCCQLNPQCSPMAMLTGLS